MSRGKALSPWVHPQPALQPCLLATPLPAGHTPATLARTSPPSSGSDPSLDLCCCFNTFYLCVLGGCIYVGVRAMLQLWRPKNYPLESVLSFYHVDPRN